MTMTRKQELIDQLAIPVEDTMNEQSLPTNSLGRFGTLWLKYMETEHPLRVMELQLTDSLFNTALEKELMAKELMQDILMQLKEGRTMAPAGTITRIQLENELRQQAEELVKAELLHYS